MYVSAWRGSGPRIVALPPYSSFLLESLICWPLPRSDRATCKRDSPTHCWKPLASIAARTGTCNVVVTRSGATPQGSCQDCRLPALFAIHLMTTRPATSKSQQSMQVCLSAHDIKAPRQWLSSVDECHMPVDEGDQNPRGSKFNAPVAAFQWLHLSLYGFTNHCICERVVLCFVWSMALVG